MNNSLLSLYYNNFRRNRWAFICMRVLFVIITISMFADLLANDKPLIIFYNNQIMLPIIHNYTESDFGGKLNIIADYRDSAVIDLIKNNDKNWMLWPIIPYSFNTIDMGLNVAIPSAPNAVHWLGTDDQGRDVLARILHGMQISLLFAFTLTIISSVIGIIMGGIQGYFGGIIDLVLQRMIEVWSSLPILYILIILSSVVVPSFAWVLIIMLLFKWMGLVSVVRAECLKVRKQQYITAAVTQGLSNTKILFSHVMPNALIAAFTFLPFQMTGAIETLAVLDLLGFGLPSGSPSLGELILQGKNNLQAIWLGLSGFFSMALLLSLLIFVGDGVRRACNPENI